MSRTAPSCLGPVTRRSFLEAGSLFFGGLVLSDLLRMRAAASTGPAARRGGDTSVILLWLPGGPPHMEMYDMKPNAPAEYRGEFRPIPTVVPGLDVCELMPRHARMADRFTIVRSVAHEFADHGGGHKRFLTGRIPASPVDFVNDAPMVGSIVAKVREGRDAGLPNYVAGTDHGRSGVDVFSFGAAYLGQSTHPFTVAGDPSGPDFKVEHLAVAPGMAGRMDDRVRLREGFDQLRRDLDGSGAVDALDEFDRRALALLTSPRARDAFDLSREDPRLRDRYGRHAWGQRALLARRLVEAGCSFVTMVLENPVPAGKPYPPGVIYNWDSHAVNGHIFDDARYRLPIYDQAVTALVEDLHDRGLDRKVMLIVTGEFGRTPRINPSNGRPGRDHWPGAMSMLLSGGGMRTGQVVGATDSRGERPRERPLTPNDLWATMYRHLGIDPSATFPDHGGRPMPILPFGDPIAELLPRLIDATSRDLSSELARNAGLDYHPAPSLLGGWRVIRSAPPRGQRAELVPRMPPKPNHVQDDRLPLDLTPAGGASVLTDRRLRQATWAFVALGVSLRVARYLMDYPLWWDEAFVAVNFLRRGYLDLLRPLDYGQVCPILFLWVELTAVKLLGFSEWSLRLFPLACAVASVFLFRVAASLLLRGLPLLLAVAVFAVSFHPIRHAADLKPYASDLLAALALLTATLSWWRVPDRPGRLWALAALVPVALAGSHPSVFVAGGIGLAVVPAVVRVGTRGVWLAYATFLFATVATFLVLFAGFTGAQASATLSTMQAQWGKAFPPLDDPRALLAWCLTVHTGSMFAYPCGGDRGASAPTLFLFVCGAVVLWRNGRRTVAAVCVAPFLVALVAAAVRRYPYGGVAHGSPARVMQYLVPGICLLTGVGAAALLVRVANPQLRARALRLGLVSLALVGIVPLLADAGHPYRAVQADRARRFALTFWPEVSRGADPVCLRWDFGLGEWDSTNLNTAVYLCNQRIYSPARARPGRRDAADPRPLRCVLSLSDPDDDRVVSRVAGLRPGFRLNDRRTFDVNMSDPGANPRVERYVVYEFVPVAGLTTSNPSARRDGSRRR